jgi:hypothetical protein
MNWRPLTLLVLRYAPESGSVSTSVGMRPQGSFTLLRLFGVPAAVQCTVLALIVSFEWQLWKLKLIQ